MRAMRADGGISWRTSATNGKTYATAMRMCVITGKIEKTITTTRVSAITEKVREEEKAKGASIEIKPTNERLLIDQARRGEIESFSALVEAHQERAVRLAYSFLGNLEDARDAAQEAFIKAFRNLDSFKGHSSFSTWLYRIVVNGCKDVLRKRKLRRHFSFWLGSEDGEGEGQWEPTAGGKNPSETLLNKELGTVCREALEDLPFRQRTAFTMRYMEGMSLKEIGESMGITEGAVKANLWQASQKMQKSLAPFLKLKERPDEA